MREKPKRLSHGKKRRLSNIALNGGNPFANMNNWEVRLNLDDPYDNLIHEVATMLFDAGKPAVAGLVSYIMKAND